MKISKITSQKSPERVNIYIDDKFAFGLDREICYKYGLKKNQAIDQEFIEQILLVEEEKKAINTALKYLGYRKRSEKEVRDKLKEKEFSNQHIENAIGYCLKYKYIDDLDFAQSFVKDKINLNKYGPKKIEVLLYQKGIDRKIVDQVLNLDRDEEYDLALQIAEKRINSYRNDDYQAQYRKLSAYLHRRGYSYSIVNKVVKEILKEE